MAGQTPSQTVGPFFAYALTPQDYGRPGIATGTVAAPDTAGEHVRIEGTVYDGDGVPVSDAMIELWQADAAGRYGHPADRRTAPAVDPRFRGFGRIGTDAAGVFRFDTVKPGRVAGPGNTLQAPHLNLIVFARGMPSHAYTRLYFADEAAANAEDPVLHLVEPARRGTLIARVEQRPGGTVHVLDIRLQGDHETVFFDA